MRRTFFLITTMVILFFASCSKDSSDDNEIESTKIDVVVVDSDNTPQVAVYTYLFLDDGVTPVDSITVVDYESVIVTNANGEASFDVANFFDNNEPKLFHIIVFDSKKGEGLYDYDVLGSVQVEINENEQKSFTLKYKE